MYEWLCLTRKNWCRGQNIMYFHCLSRDTYCSKKYFIYATEQWKGLCGISAAEIYSICDSKNARKNNNHFGYWVDFGYWEGSGAGVNYWISYSRPTSCWCTYCHYALEVSPFFHTYLSLLSINDYQSSMKYFTKDGQFHLNICLRGLHARRASHIFFQYNTKWLRVRQSESF